MPSSLVNILLNLILLAVANATQGTVFLQNDIFQKGIGFHLRKFMHLEQLKAKTIVLVLYV